jgi:AcrR family transcriptional regulator
MFEKFLQLPLLRVIDYIENIPYYDEIESTFLSVLSGELTLCRNLSGNCTKPEKMQGENMAEKTDIRIRFTQKVLQESLISLVKEKSILDISIKEICERAGLSRSTFYLYYHDQYELLRKIEEEAFIEMEKIFSPYKSGERKSDGRVTTAFLQDILQSIADNSNSIHILLSENGDGAFQKRFFRNGIESIRQFTEATGVKPQDKGVATYRSVFLAGGILSLVQEWLQNGMDTPVPDLAKMLARLIRDALR